MPLTLGRLPRRRSFRRLHGGGIGPLLERQPPWLDLPLRDEASDQASSAERLKRLFRFMQPRLCVTVTAPTMAELRRRRDAVADADVIELRLDSVGDPDVAGALSGRRRKVIVTCRPTWEGGGFTGS